MKTIEMTEIARNKAAKFLGLAELKRGFIYRLFLLRFGWWSVEMELWAG